LIWEITFKFKPGHLKRRLPAMCSMVAVQD
ncbi:unnamed protein product, partial [marine sediment metagenome]